MTEEGSVIMDNTSCPCPDVQEDPANDKIVLLAARIGNLLSNCYDVAQCVLRNLTLMELHKSRKVCRLWNSVAVKTMAARCQPYYMTHHMHCRKYGTEQQDHNCMHHHCRELLQYCPSVPALCLIFSTLATVAPRRSAIELTDYVNEQLPARCLVVNLSNVDMIGTVQRGLQGVTKPTPDTLCLDCQHCSGHPKHQHSAPRESPPLPCCCHHCTPMRGAASMAPLPSTATEEAQLQQVPQTQMICCLSHSISNAINQTKLSVDNQCINPHWVSKAKFQQTFKERYSENVSKLLKVEHFKIYRNFFNGMHVFIHNFSPDHLLEDYGILENPSGLHYYEICDDRYVLRSSLSRIRRRFRQSLKFQSRSNSVENESLGKDELFLKKRKHITTEEDEAMPSKSTYSITECDASPLSTAVTTQPDFNVGYSIFSESEFDGVSRNSCKHAAGVHYSMLCLPDNIPGVRFVPIFCNCGIHYRGDGKIVCKSVPMVEVIQQTDDLKALLVFQQDEANITVCMDKIMKIAVSKTGGHIAVGGTVVALCDVDTTNDEPNTREPNRYKARDLNCCIAVCGEGVVAATVLLGRDVRSADAVMAELSKLKPIYKPGKRSLAFMFTCAGRGNLWYHLPAKVANMEVEMFRILFPATPIFGTGGQGEFGHAYQPQSDGTSSVDQDIKVAKQLKKYSKDYRLESCLLHSYTTVILFLQFQY